MNDDRYFELPAPEVFGPQGVHVVALLERARHLTPDEASALGPVRDDAMDDAMDDARRTAWGAAWGASWGAVRGTAREAAWDAAGDAVRDAVRDAAREAAWGAAWAAAWAAVWDAVRGAARALVVRDLIATEDYNTLTRAWREVIGPIHPDDPDIGRAAR